MLPYYPTMVMNQLTLSYTLCIHNDVYNWTEHLAACTHAFWAGSKVTDAQWLHRTNLYDDKDEL